MIVRELLFLIGFDYDPSGASAAERGFRGLIGLGGTVVATLGAVGAALALLARETAEVGEEAYNASVRLGITTDEYQRLTYAGERAGVSTEDLTGALQTLQGTAASASFGSAEANVALARLGTSAFGAGGKTKPLVTLLEDVADGLTHVRDPARRAALMQQVLGESSAALLPFLLRGRAGIRELAAEAEGLGYVLSSETIDASRRLQAGLRDLDLETVGWGRYLGAKLTPELERVTASLLRFLRANRATIHDGLDKIAQALATLVNGLYVAGRFVMENQRFFAILAAVIGGALLGNFLSLTGVLSAVRWLLGAIFSKATLAVVGFAAIAAVIEDVYVWATGGKSAIGALFDEFLSRPISPKDHWLVLVFREVLSLIRDVLQGWDEIFRVIIDPSYRDMFVQGLAAMARDAAAEIKRTFMELLAWLSDQFQASPVLRVFLGATSGGVSELLGNVLRMATEPGTGPLAPTLAAVGARGAGASVQVAGAQVEINMSLPEGSDAQSIAEQTASQVSEVMRQSSEQQAREMLRAVAPRLR